MKLKNIVFLFILLNFYKGTTQQVINLYDGVAPGSETWNWDEKEFTSNIFNTRVVYNVSKPTITAYLPRPEISTGAAVIIAPRGAFHIISIESEGTDLAKYLNSKGVAAFVLKYRLVKSETEDPMKELMPLLMGDKKKLDAVNAPVVPLAMQDGLTAVKYVRSHAKDFEIDTNQIGFIGFSAGGTVAMSVLNNATDENRPNFIALIYPYMGAVNDSKVPKQKTPAFVAVAADDQFGSTSQSLDIYNKWTSAGQQVELHVYEKGGHGFGVRKQNLPSDTWHERFGDWMKSQGYLEKLHPTQYEKDFTEEQRAEHQKQNELHQKNDWANLTKFKDDNAKLASPQPNENRVVFLGNSIVEAWMRMQPQYFTNGKIARGISGQTSPQTVLRFRQDVVDLKPKIVIISIGINDIAENTGPYNPDFTIGNIRTMIEVAQANNIKVILASVHPAIQFSWRKEVPDAANKIVQLNERIKALAKEKNLVYLDYHSAMRNAQNGLSSDMAEDGVHPTIAGYNIMAPLADKAIEETLKQR